MTYNQFIEGVTGLKDALYDLFLLDVDQNKLELKDLIIKQPKHTYNECMVLQESYSYEVTIVTQFWDGPEKGKEFSATVEIPKMCERGFLIKGYNDNKIKWRAPVNYGKINKVIGCRSKIPYKYIFISNICSIYPFKSDKNNIPRISLNKTGDKNKGINIDLGRYLSKYGFTDIYDLIGGPYDLPKDYKDDIYKIEIPTDLIKPISNKYLQLTELDAEIDDMDPVLSPKMIYNLVKSCIKNPNDFDVFTPIDITFNNFHTTLFKNDIYRYKLIRNNLANYMTKYRALNPSIIQKAIDSTFNMLGDENAVQAGALSNALSFISQTNKVYFRDYNRQKSLLRYTDDFYGVICPAKTPESVGLCGIKNEFASSVKVSDDEVLITVMTKSGELKDLTYMEYFRSKVLLHECYNYENNKVVPNKYGKLKVIYKGKFTLVDNSIDNVDYIMSNPESGLSYNAGLIPFMNRCDGTRLSMATNMSDQAVPIVGGRRSVITTKLSSTIYQKSDLNWKSDYDGVVEDIYNGYIKIKDDSGEVHIISTPEEVTSSTHSCNLFVPAVKPGDRIKKGDVLMESNSFRGKYLALTVPLKVAFINYSSKTDEDAFVISDRAAELLGHEIKKDIVIDIPSNRKFLLNKDKILERVEVIQDDSKKSKQLNYDKVPVKSKSKGLNEFGLPQIGDTYRTGELVAMCLCESDSDDPRHELAELTGATGDELLDFYDPKFIPVPYGLDKCKIEDIRVFYKPSMINNPQAKELIEYYDNIHKSKLEDIKNHLGEYNYLEKNCEFNDNNPYDPDLRIVIKISAINPIKIGDKISNRFGGKGTISAIIPINDMPRIGGEDGEKVDICVPPKSVINRKNFSQMYECNLAELSKLAWKLNSEYIKNKEFDKVRDVLNHLYVTDKYSKFSDEKLIKFHESFDTYYTIEVGAFDNTYTNQVFIELNKYFNYNISGDKVYLPKTDEFGPRWITQEVTATHGTIEFERLHFYPEDKAKATSVLGYHDELILGVGKSRAGGQRIGQMEVWALIGYDTLKEFHDLSKNIGDNSSSADYTANSITTQMLLIGLLTKTKN